LPREAAAGTLTSAAGAAFLILASMLPAVAQYGEPGRPCQCRAEGRMLEEGQTICMRVNGRSDTYRCERVQNVTSWRKIIDGCPQS
jgi:hypothetical protein